MNQLVLFHFLGEEAIVIFDLIILPGRRDACVSWGISLTSVAERDFLTPLITVAR